MNRGTSGDFLTDGVRAGVRSGDNDGVAETNFAVFLIAEDAFVENLEESGENGRVGFLDFIEENNGERLFHDLRGKAERIGGTVANETRDVGGRNKFVHVEANDVFFAIEINFRKRFGELSFTDAGGAKEEKGADGASLIFNAGGGTTESIGDGRNGFFLIDHAFVDEMFEAEEFFAISGVVGDFDFDTVRFLDSSLDGGFGNETVFGITGS